MDGDTGSRLVPSTPTRGLGTLSHNSRPRSARVKGLGVTGLLMLVTVLSGCSAPGAGVDSSFCSTYEQSWDVYAAVRAAAASTADDLIAARTTLTAYWDTASSSDISDEVKETIKVANQDFVAAYNGSKSAQTSFWNGQDLVAARCSQVGTPITFDDRQSPIAPTR